MAGHLKALVRVWAAVKAATLGLTLRFARGASWGAGLAATWLNHTRLDIRRRVGEGDRNSIVVACVNWICRTWPEAPIVVRTVSAGGVVETVDDHPLARLLRRPNPYYSGRQLLTATLADRRLRGNAYWLKVRGARGNVVELWWLPAASVAPAWPKDDDTVFISHYEYTVNGRKTEYPPEDIVHFRVGFDPNNVRQGRSEIADLLGELFTDEEASSYVASVLANMGVPGVVISPDADSGASDEDLEEVKKKFQERFGGDQRGEPLVMKGPTKVSVLSFSPKDMTVRELRRIPEERVTAAIGIPAIVVGLGAGLDRSTFANMAEAREAAYEGHIIPDQALFDDDLNLQLVPDFGDPDRLRVEHDYSKVRVLQQDENELHARAREDLKAGLLTLDQALQMIGEEPLGGEAGAVRYVPKVVTVTRAEDLGVPPLPVAPPTPLRALPLPADSEDDAVSTDDAPAKRKRRRRGLRKDADEIGPELDRRRQEAETAWIEAMVTFLSEQAGRVSSRLTSASQGADELFGDGEVEALRAVLERLQAAMLAETHGVVTAALGVAFDLDDPLTRRYLDDAGANIAGISDTTRAAIRRALGDGQAAGEGVHQLAARIRNAAAFGRPRAETIARTELGTAQNLAALANYRASGVVVGVRVRDGDYDAACADMDGRTFGLDDAPAALQHPRCLRAFLPLTDASALRGAA